MLFLYVTKLSSVFYIASTSFPIDLTIFTTNLKNQTGIAGKMSLLLIFMSRYAGERIYEPIFACFLQKSYSGSDKLLSVLLISSSSLDTQPRIFGA
jgi:hypothetical protein